MGRAWQKEEDKSLVRMIKSGMPYWKIAIKLDRSISAIWNRAKLGRTKRFIDFRESYWDLDLILMEVAKFYQLSHLDIIQKNRETSVRIPRQVCHKLAVENTELSPATIAYYIGRLSRFSVNNSLKKIDGYLDVDKKFKTEYIELEKIVINEINKRK